DALTFDTNAVYYGRQLANVGVTDCTVSTRIIGRASAGGDRHYGIGLGLPAPTAADGIGGVMYYLTNGGTLTGGQIVSAWSPPTGARVTGIAMSDDMLMSVTLDGLNVAVDIDGNTVYTETIAVAPTGTYAGAGQYRAQWSTNVGYK